MNTDELLPTIEIETGSAPQAAIIWLHGLGADGHDFVPIVKELPIATAPAIRFIFPHAPEIPVSINGGYRMRAWYDIAHIDLVRHEDEAGLRASQKQIDALIRQQNSRGIATRNIALAGFSQGCAMALMTGLRYPEKLAGIIGLSGYLPLLDKTETERHAANRDTPIWLGHGQFDSVVPMERAQRSRDCLLQFGYRLAWHEYPIDHGLCADEVDDIGKFIDSIFDQTSVITVNQTS